MLTFTVLTFAGGCAEYFVYKHDYQRAGPPGKPAKGNRSGLAIVSSESSKKVGCMSSERRTGPPYTVSVFAYAEAESDRKLTVHELTMEHDGKTTVLVAAADKPRTASLEKRKGFSERKAAVRLELGDKLDFVEGSTVELRATVELPYDAEHQTISRTLKATKYEGSAYWFQQ